MFTTKSPDYLIRGTIWSTELKTVLEDDLMAAQFVRTLDGFPDGDTFQIPSIGQATVDDYIEDTPVTYRGVDTGLWQFSITEYLQSGYYITNKMLQDSFYMKEVMAQMPSKMTRALMVRYETDVFKQAMKQTPSNSNAINGASHRFVASGTGETITLEDFARARYALQKANVSQGRLVAVVDPSVGYYLSTLQNITNVSNNPKFEGLITQGMTDATGMRFVYNIYGFDVYVSNYLPDANETINAKTTTAGKANLFFSANPDELPFVGAWRQAPRVDSEYNKDRQREEHVVTARYGLGLYRPEALVVILADTDTITF